MIAPYLVRGYEERLSTRLTSGRSSTFASGGGGLLRIRTGREGASAVVLDQEVRANEVHNNDIVRSRRRCCFLSWCRKVINFIIRVPISFTSAVRMIKCF